jgi:drug/metabolite transporter (DMT)-like permease
MIANVRRFSTSARKSMTVPRSTALRTALAVAATLSAAFFWGLNGTVSKVLYRDAGFDAFQLLAARGLWTLPIFALLAVIARPERGPSAADWRRIIALGLCYGPVACGFLAASAQFTSGAHISLLFSLAPPLTAVAGGWLLRERIDPIRVVALGVGLGGAILLASTRSATGSSPLGDLFMLVQIVGITGTFIITRSLGRRHNALFLSGMYGAIGMLGILAIGVLGGGSGGVMRALQDPPTALMFFGEIVFGLSVYSQVAQSYALRALAAGTTSVLASYGSLVVGVVSSLILLHERVTLPGIVAGAMIALALALALVPTRKAGVQ